MTSPGPSRAGGCPGREIRPVAHPPPPPSAPGADLWEGEELPQLPRVMGEREGASASSSSLPWPLRPLPRLFVASCLLMSTLAPAHAGDLGGEEEPPCSSSVAPLDSCPGPHGLFRTPTVPESSESWPSLGPVASPPLGLLQMGRQAQACGLPARPFRAPRPVTCLGVNISPACPEGFPEPSARRLTTHLSMRQPTFLEPPVCSSLDGQSGHMGSQLRSSRLEPACRWAWGRPCAWGRQLSVSAVYLT